MSAVENVMQALEAVIFSSEGPVTPARLRRVFRDLTPAKIAEAVHAINTQLDKEGRPYQIAEVAGGYQFRTRPEYGEVLRAAQPERKVRLSRPALESLAVIAYKQPLTRAELEELRSVDCGAILKSLLERDLARIVGRRDAPGRPVLYGTSATFLELFGLASLRDLPSLRDIETMAADQGVSIEEAAGEDSGVAPEAGAGAAVAAEDEDAAEGRDSREEDADPDWSEGDWPEEEDASA